MSLMPDDITALIEALADHPLVAAKGVRFAPVSQARFHRISTGTLTWDWRDRDPAERGLRAAMAYYDLDGQIVSVTIVKVEDEVTEIELWRGDNQPILTVPKQADLWEMLPGRVYSPRA